MTAGIDFFDRLDKILVYRRGEFRAPHKPLYLLYCIAGLQTGRERLQSFEKVSAELKAALQLFGPRAASVHPEYPFWRLQHDALAEVVAEGSLQVRASNSEPTVSSLREANARGGLLAQDFELLSGDLPLQSLAIHKILDAHFPACIHDELLYFFGLTLDNPHSADRKSDREFRDDVLVAYGGRCALTNFGLAVGSEVFGVEATHLFWPQAGGNDDVSNGVAMSTLHRKLFNLGFL